MTLFTGRAVPWHACSWVPGLAFPTWQPGLTHSKDTYFPTCLLPQLCEQGREVAQAGSGTFKVMLSVSSHCMGLAAGEASAL